MWRKRIPGEIVPMAEGRGSCRITQGKIILEPRTSQRRRITPLNGRKEWFMKIKHEHIRMAIECLGRVRTVKSSGVAKITGGLFRTGNDVPWNCTTTAIQKSRLVHRRKFSAGGRKTPLAMRLGKFRRCYQQSNKQCHLCWRSDAQPQFSLFRELVETRGTTGERRWWFCREWQPPVSTRWMQAWQGNAVVMHQKARCSVLASSKPGMVLSQGRLHRHDLIRGSSNGSPAAARHSNDEGASMARSGDHSSSDWQRVNQRLKRGDSGTGKETAGWRRRSVTVGVMKAISHCLNVENLKQQLRRRVRHINRKRKLAPAKMTR